MMFIDTIRIYGNPADEHPNCSTTKANFNNEIRHSNCIFVQFGTRVNFLLCSLNPPSVTKSFTRELVCGDAAQV